ncbi:MAG TPA: ergothioneine biosynthesis protein EgtC [Xenococcaceae cyanobacterium]
MCRLLAYIGSKLQLDTLLYKPEHSLINQSYQPQEMTAGVLNADGFGLGWYHSEKQDLPYTYKHTLPIWSDINLHQLARYVESNCFLGYVRSATPGLPVDLINCQPFTEHNLMFIHNGYIDKFRPTLYRPIRNLLNDYTYRAIHGTTDSEHIFALIVNQLQNEPKASIEIALKKALQQLEALAEQDQIYVSANIILADGDRLIASRFANRQPQPTLYWLQDDPIYANGVIIASEPMFEGNWQSLPHSSIITIGKNLEVKIQSIY